MIGSSVNPVYDIDVMLRRKFPMNKRVVYLFPVSCMHSSIISLRTWLHKNDYLSIGTDEVVNLGGRSDMIRIMKYMSSLSSGSMPIFIDKYDRLDNVVELDQVYRSRRWSLSSLFCLK